MVVIPAEQYREMYEQALKKNGGDVQAASQAIIDISNALNLEERKLAVASAVNRDADLQIEKTGMAGNLPVEVGVANGAATDASKRVQDSLSAIKSSAE